MTDITLAAFSGVIVSELYYYDKIETLEGWFDESILG